MDEERYLILKMLEEGKITAEEASALIAALEDEGAGGETGGAGAGTEGAGTGGAGSEGAPGREGRRHGQSRAHFRGRWFDDERFEGAMEELRRDLEKVRLGAMDIGDEVSRHVQQVMRGQNEVWRRGGPRGFRHLVRNLGDVFSVPFGREMFEDRFEKEVSVNPDVTVGVQDLSGDVAVETHDSATVKVEAVKRVWAATAREAEDRSADYRVVVEQEGNEVRIGAELTDDAPGWLPARCTIDYKVLVPAGARLRVDLTNGDVTVKGVRGGVDLRSTNGDVVGKGLSGPVVATSINGNVEILSAEPGDLSLKTVNGDIRFDLLSLGDGEHSVGTTRGEIQAFLAAGMSLEFTASTMHGDIDLDLPCTVARRSSSRLEGRLGGGASGPVPLLAMRTLFGDITLEARKEG